MLDKDDIRLADKVVADSVSNIVALVVRDV